MKRTYATAIALATALLAPAAYAERVEDIQAPRAVDHQAPRYQEEIQAPRGQDFQAPRGQQEDVQTARGQEYQAPRA
jgi:hypothetical protein